MWFVAPGTTDTCKKFITVSGVDYTDSIYALNKSSVVAKPIYNANKTQPIDCNGDCQFDNGNSLTSQGVVINKSTGKIDLKKTISNGALGTNPADGTFKDFLLNYKISDKSGKAQNHMGFRLYYYKQKSSIPKKLLEDLNTKKSEVFEDDDNSPDDKHLELVRCSTSLTAKHGKGEVKCRPPYIIVTQN